MSFVTIKHLTKFYSKEEPVISNMNLEFPETGLNIVVGKSGCGKTTLLNTIGSLDNDYVGTVKVDGKIISKMNASEMSQYKNFTIGYIFQKDDLFEELTVEENLKIVLGMQNKKADIDATLEKVGLSGFGNRKVKYLSGGERQRVGIARVIIKDCKIILADEPTSALDKNNGHRIFKLLKEISKDRLVIAVTHDTKKAFQYADRIIKLSDGNVIDDEIINECKNEGKKVEVRKSNPLALLPIFKFQFSHGLFINIFVSLLIALAMIVCSVSADQKLVKDEYSKYEKMGYTDLNVKRTIMTQVENGIDDWIIVNATDEFDAYEYIRLVGDKESRLSIDEVNEIKDKYNFSSFSVADASVGGLYLKYLSPEYYGSMQITKIGEINWNCYAPSNVSYYLFDKDNEYDYIGSLPHEGTYEMLVSDTFAEAYLIKDVKYVTDKDDPNYGQRIIYDGDITKIIGQKINIFEAYHSVYDSVTKHDYVFFDTVEFTVTGIVNTHQLDYMYYDSSSSSYRYLTKIKTQTENEYMNQSFCRPDIFVYTGVDIVSSTTQNKNHPFISDLLGISSIEYNSKQVAEGIKAFMDSVDYRYYQYPILYNDPELGTSDDVYQDRNDRLICKTNIFNASKRYLEENEVILPLATLKKIYSEATEDNASNYLNRKVTLSFKYGDDTIQREVSIVGVAKDDKEACIYVSSDLYKSVYDLTLEEEEYALRVSLKGMNAQARMNLMEQLFDDGYIIYPVDVMPGAYSEFIYEKSIGVFDEGEEGNISPYYLFSEYYNLDNVKKTNRLLDILSTILTFTVVVALIVTLGCVYLNERRHRLHIIKLSIIGVTPSKILLMQTVTYVLMAILTFVLTLLGTLAFVNVVNGSIGLSIETVNNYGESVQMIIERVRIVLTSNVFVYASLGAVLMLAVGVICSFIAIKQYKK